MGGDQTSAQKSPNLQTKFLLSHVYKREIMVQSLNYYLVLGLRSILHKLHLYSYWLGGGSDVHTAILKVQHINSFTPGGNISTT